MTTTFAGTRRPAQFPVMRRPLRLPLLVTVLWWLLVRIPVWIVLGLARSPVALTCFSLGVATFAAWKLAGPVLAIGIYVLILAAFVVVRFRTPDFYERHVALLIRSRWRRSMYEAKWSPTMDFAKLTGTKANGVRYEPALLSVRCTRYVDRVRARMVA